MLVGCFLAFKSRNVDRRYGESKQLIFAMYNIALVGIVFLILLSVADIDPSGSRLLQGVGVWWGTVFSSAAFVIPRLVIIRQNRANGSSRRNASHQSGFGSQNGLGSIREIADGDSTRIARLANDNEADTNASAPEIEENRQSTQE